MLLLTRNCKHVIVMCFSSYCYTYGWLDVVIMTSLWHPMCSLEMSMCPLNSGLLNYKRV